MKWSFSDLSRTLPWLVAHGEAGEILRELGSRFHSDEEWFLLRRDAEQSITAPSPKIPIHVRPLRKEDEARILVERPIRRAALDAHLTTCFVAVTDENDICYMQWLIDSSQNELIRQRFAGLCPPLARNEMFLEWAYTFRKYRGLGIMAPAMAQIADLGVQRGARWLYTFVEQSNIPSLRGCRSAGFRPYKIRRDRWRFFRCEERFTTLPPDTKYSFEMAPKN